MRDERGFTLIETMLAIVVLSMMVLISGGLWQATQAADTESDLLFQLSREAASTMEEWRMETMPSAGTTSRVWRWNQISVTETKSVQWEDGLWKLSLTYSWQERGRAREQTWATLRLL